MKRWPKIRAGLIAAAIGFGLVDGCPLPPPDKTPAWNRAVVEPLRRAQQVVMTPLAWVRPTLRIAQRWSLYQAPSTDRFRLWIEGREPSGAWRVLFRAGDGEHDEDGERIDYTRPRGTWDPTQRVPQQYLPFARWVTAEVLARHPDLSAARVRLEHVRIDGPRVVPLGTFAHPFVRPRGMP